MCGIAGIYHIDPSRDVDKGSLQDMTAALQHRGPDQTACFVRGNTGMGFQRLSIVDLENGMQPFFSEDGLITLVCNGEIYNYKQLRAEMQKKGHRFRTECDIEVLLPLYIEFGLDFLTKLNGQFAIAIVDGRDNSLLLARDHFGICPLFYSYTGGTLLFGSEIKALLKHDGIDKKVDLTGLDQVFSFPGLVSPHTMFQQVKSVKPGSWLLLKEGRIKKEIYWDLCYPLIDHSYPSLAEADYMEGLEQHLLRSVRDRLNADVPVGYYLSGGLDSSLIGAMMKKVNPGSSYQSFSIAYSDPRDNEIDESPYQRIVSTHLGSTHNQILMGRDDIGRMMSKMIFHSECPLKETYNVCSMALSRAARDKNIKVILSGEGADEFFGGYVGYRFDLQRCGSKTKRSVEQLLEEQENRDLWGDGQFFYEKNYHEFSEIKRSLYSDRVNRQYSQFNSYRRLELDKNKISGCDNFNKRSYLDLKLRLSDHLIADHCDRTCYANSVEGRYPFLDVELVEFVKLIPSGLKLNNLVEKYILKQLGRKYLPETIVNRQKQGFVAPGSPFLLENNVEWVNDMLSYRLIERQGYFDPDAIERVKKMYSQKGFSLNLPYDSDLLIIVLTFNVFLEVFQIPDL